MRIKWIGQSGYVIHTDSTTIYIDPYLSDVVNRLAGRPRLVEPPICPSEISADAIICTHKHLDHLDVDAIGQMHRQQYFITTLEGRDCLEGMGFLKVQPLCIGESVVVGDIEITAVYANHTVEAFGIILRTEGYTLYFSGDTLFDERLFGIAKYHPDISFLCINGKLGNMNVDEAVTVAKHIGGKINIPNHYGMFASNTEDPKMFTDQLDNGFIMEFNKEYALKEILL